MRIAPSIQVTATERRQLAQWTRGRRTPARLVLRAKITLLAAEGHNNQPIAALDTSRQTVGLWRQRFVTQRLVGLAQDAPRGGRPPKARQALIARILTTTTQTTPPGATPGRPAPWPDTCARTPRSCSESGPPMACSPIESGPLHSAGIRTSRTSWRTWWACICTRPSMPWSCAWMRKASSKPWIARSPACRSNPVAAAR